MTYTQKIAIAGAVLGSLAVVLLKKIMDRVEEIENYKARDDVPVLKPVRDAAPQQEEPLPSDDLAIAQNAPL